MRVGVDIRGTKSWCIFRPLPNGRALLCHARMGNTAREAWENAVDVTKVSKAEFKRSGWKAGRVRVEERVFA